jgi:hypothetical protein
MVLRKLVMNLAGAGLLASLVAVAPGCTGADSGQPARESLSIPRKGGGMENTTAEKVKTKAPEKAVEKDK